MSPFARFLADLLFEGRVAIGLHDDRSAAAADVPALLERAYQIYCLDVAGPVVPFDSATAVAAARLIERACWHLVSTQGGESELEREIRMPRPPRTAAEHLSADMLLRYVPQILRRARSRAPADRLVILLEDIMRRFPLSGVLSDVAEPPLTDLHFAGHSGLLMRYAERLAANEKPAWFPSEQFGLAWIELVKNEHR